MPNNKTKNSKKAKTYFTGIPCLRGHIAERYLSNRTCVVCCNKDLSINQRTRYRNSTNTLAKQFVNRRHRALKRGIPFTITFNEIKQPEYCPILGIKLNYGYCGSNGQMDHAKATLDKVVPELGYIPGNVFVISWRANSLKSNATLQELDKIRKYIKEKTRGKTIRYK